VVLCRCCCCCWCCCCCYYCEVVFVCVVLWFIWLRTAVYVLSC
jgi:hypothetical protein